MSQGEEEERKMKHTLAFHAEGKNAEIHDYYQIEAQLMVLG